MKRRGEIEGEYSVFCISVFGDFCLEPEVEDMNVSRT